MNDLTLVESLLSGSFLLVCCHFSKILIDQLFTKSSSSEPCKVSQFPHTDIYLKSLLLALHVCSSVSCFSQCLLFFHNRSWRKGETTHGESLECYVMIWVIHIHWVITSGESMKNIIEEGLPQEWLKFEVDLSLF